ncbi:hypothetical protein VTL71DRAFT_12688 [Oculimacula yallundae]|uniref:SP-RING-type domain-containing protein n=1 Tax=Oculimacula yallundae TaxID=86028 RepID=A0ABR4CQ18_9HELO
MRRPPDKEGQSVLSEKDVESSNATLNTLFGGSRQKSWMMGPGAAPVRPTPRTGISKPSILPTVSAQRPQRSAVAILPSPAPSDEPSPILPHSGIYRTQDTRQESRISTAHSPTATFTQYQQITPGEPVTELTPESHPTESSSRPSTSSSRPPNHSRRSSINPILSADTFATMDNPPLPSSVLLPAERQNQRDTPRELYSPSPTSTPIVQHRALPSPRISSLSGLGITTRAPVERDQSVNSGHVNISSVARVGDFPSPTSNSSHPSPSMPTALNPNKRQRTQPPAISSLRPHINLIEKHIQSVGGLNNLNTGLERPRFQLLTEACNNEDSFYVALHQVFCLWDYNRAEVTSIPGYPNSTVLQKAFNILGQLIRDNVQLAPNHKMWFANFPSQLNQLLIHSEPYRRTIMDVGAFLSRLASDWDTLSNELTQRGYPPLVDEFVTRWRLLSPTLQSVVFTAIRRNLSFHDQDCGPQAEELFRRDRQEHLALASRINTARPPTANDFRERNNALVNEYLTLRNRIVQRRSSTAMPGSPLMRGPTPVLSSNVPYQQTVPLVHTASWQANIPSPDPSGSWQQQGVPRTSTSSPNPSLIAGRPPSVGSHRMQTNAPSPTLLQGLSMNSPGQQNFQVSPAIGNNAQMPSNQNTVHGYAGSNVNRAYIHYQPSMDLAAQQRNQLAMQHQQMLPQQQFQPANPSQYPVHQPMQAQQPQQQFSPPNPSQYQPMQNQLPQYQPQQYQQRQQIHYQPAQAALQEHSVRSAQHQTMLQQRQIQMEQQVHASNRAAQIRSNSTNDPQHTHARHNSVNSTGQRNPIIGPSPRIGVPPNLAVGRPMITLEQISNAYKAKHPMNRSIVPPIGYVHESFPTIPDQVALHQAHLRSPRLVAADVAPGDVPIDSPSLRYYQTIRGFALPPTRLSINSPLSKFDFRPSEAELAMIAQDSVHSNGQVASRQFRRGTLQYRLRCVQVRQGTTKCLTADWVLKDTVWPEGASLAINKQHLELRRKNHHGKDLPLDVTPMVRMFAPHVSCQIALSILKGRSRMKDHSYFIAVEVVEILQHDQILGLVRKNRISATTSLENIKRSIGGNAEDGDDDIAMVVSDLSIDLADPFTARIYDTPVRGMNCLHRECFDLETFLITRISKPKRTGQPCMIDVWKCPLCGKDARPHRLQIDDFLVSVRQTLEAQGNLDAKAIWISGDGTWRPKIEKRKSPPDADDSDSEDDVPGGPNTSLHQAGDRRSSRAVEVISLDDD